eukprot:2367311-Prorocentrum_lima.AAC.1
MENDPRIYVAGLIAAAMRRYRGWYYPQWDQQTAWGTPSTDFDQYIDDVSDRASQGGLLELSAA